MAGMIVAMRVYMHMNIVLGFARLGTDLRLMGCASMWVSHGVEMFRGRFRRGRQFFGRAVFCLRIANECRKHKK